MSRMRLLGVTGLILATPLLCMLAVIIGEQADPAPCLYRFPNQEAQINRNVVRLSAWSVSDARSVPEPESAPGNQWLRGAELSPPPGASWLRSATARQDLTYVRCSSDPDQRHAFLWFALYDRAELQPWLTDPPDSTSHRLYRFLASEPRHDPVTARRHELARAHLKELALSGSELLPSWLDAKTLIDANIVGWVDRGVLLATDAGHQLLLVNQERGFIAEAIPGCTDGTELTPCLRL